jgi:hypothetical protein
MFSVQNNRYGVSGTVIGNIRRLSGIDSKLIQSIAEIIETLNDVTGPSSNESEFEEKLIDYLTSLNYYAKHQNYNYENKLTVLYRSIESNILSLSGNKAPPSSYPPQMAQIAYPPPNSNSISTTKTIPNAKIPPALLDITSAQNTAFYAQLPENIGKLFLSEALKAGMSSAMRVVRQMCGHPDVLQMDLITDENTRDTFADLCAVFILMNAVNAPGKSVPKHVIDTYYIQRDRLILRFKQLRYNSRDKSFEFANESARSASRQHRDIPMYTDHNDDPFEKYY